jgi:RNA polymerase sigma-70 factor (ECF subfamily)
MDDFSAYKTRPGRDTLLVLLKAQQDTVYNLCYQVLRHPQNAQDAAQQVLMGLLEALPKIADGAHLKQWLHRAAFHVCLDLKKVQKRRREREARVAKMDESALPDEIADLVQLHISRLDDELRTLVVEHYFDQKPLGLLAAERGVSPVAVWKKLDRAKERLRDSLTRAGHASALPALDPFLASLKPVAAPKGLLTKAMLAKAAGAAALGGIAMKIKAIAAIAVLVLGAAGALGVAAVRRRDERRREVELKEEAAAKLRAAAATAKVPVARSQAGTAAPAPAAAAPEPEEIEIFKTQREFQEAFRKAFGIQDDLARWKALRRIGFLRSPRQFRKVEGELRARAGSPEYENAWIGGLLKDWVETDFKGVIDFMMRMPAEDSASKPQKLGRTLLGLATMKRDAALDYARSLTEEEGRSEVLEMLSAADPPTKEAVLAMPPGHERIEALKRLVVYWVGKDPRAAARWIEQLSDAEERGDARAALAYGWGRSDVRAAAAWVQENSDGAERTGLLRDLIGGAAYTDPRGAAELAAKSFEGKDLWCLEMERAFKGWSESDPASAARFLEALSGPARGGGSHWLPGVAKHWALRDPSAALEWAETLEGEERTVALMAVSEGLVKSIISNPKEALSVLDKLPASRREEALSGIVEAWTDIDPRAAAEFARSRPESAATLDEVIARRWANRDLEAAIAWARSLPEGIGRDSALEAAALSCAGWNPVRASELPREIRDAGVRDQALSYVARLLGGKDLPKAIGMATEIANSELRRDAQGALLGSCGGADPQACLAMLSGMQNATKSEYGAFALSWAQKDPRAAMDWADGLSQPELRDWSLNYTFTQFACSEPDAARAWVERARLTDAQRQKFQKAIPARK